MRQGFITTSHKRLQASSGSIHDEKIIRSANGLSCTGWHQITSLLEIHSLLLPSITVTKSELIQKKKEKENTKW